MVLVYVRSFRAWMRGSVRGGSLFVCMVGGVRGGVAGSAGPHGMLIMRCGPLTHADECAGGVGQCRCPGWYECCCGMWGCAWWGCVVCRGLGGVGVLGRWGDRTAMVEQVVSEVWCGSGGCRELGSDEQEDGDDGHFQNRF